MGVALLRKSILLENPFDETLSRYEDLKAILNWIKKAKIYSTNESVMIYRTEFCQLSKILTSIDVNKDFTFHLDFKNKGFWEKCILGELLYLSLIGYKNKRFLLIKKYKQNILFALIAKLNFILQKIKLCLVK